METVKVDVAVALLLVDVVEDLVVDVEVVVGFVDVEDEDDALTELELDELLEQVPPTGLHPVPQ